MTSAYEENLPCRVSIEILNEKCKMLRIFRNLEIHRFNVVDVRRLPRGITRHLVRVPVEHLAKFSKRVDARMRNSVRVGEEIVAWFETDGCDVCNTIVSKGAFLITAWNTEKDKLVYTFIAPSMGAAQNIILTLETLNFELKILGIERYRRRIQVLTKKQEMALWLALEAGFFDYPKKISISDLSRKLKISPSTLSEIMRRGIRRLLEYYFENL
ncbi:helix-turn-helix domain-containing protein [Candidatus Bathyarchaeota archaeon]|nr:helix-turn-helix domain-containing protein [Candidatus Bathyarchaeota archaeon]